MIYIIAHNRVDFDNFYCDNQLDKSMFSFFLTEGKKKNIKISNALIDKISKENFSCVREWELGSYNNSLQKKRFFAPSILYHCHLNEFKDEDSYMGFMEYDLSFYERMWYKTQWGIADKSPQTETNISICDKIKELIVNDEFIILLSARHKVAHLNSQKDIKFNNEHWFVAFFKDYNKRYGTSYNHVEFLKKYGETLVPTQQSFICDVKTYKQISEYVYNFINDYGEINLYKPFPATILERFIGMYILLISNNINNVFHLPLKHLHASGGVY